MRIELAFTVVATFVISFVVTGRVRRLALSLGALDLPNERSSHKIPTPRGGGLAIVLATIAAWLILAAQGVLSMDVLMALVGGGAIVSGIGFVDDRCGLSAKVRLAVHFAAAVWALVWLGGLPPLQVGDRLIAFGWVGYLLGALGIVWTLNLFNFMDGIDGIAASEAIFVASAGALLTGATGAAPAAALVFVAGCCGFLVWNWPPARIFMGDVGSGYIGYVVAVLALVAAREDPVALLVWLTLGGIFFVDATVTFLRRLLRGEPVYQAHRSHAYQYLASRWDSHLLVTASTLAMNIGILLPCAALAATYPRYAAYISLATLAVLVPAALLSGAGRRGKVAQ